MEHLKGIVLRTVKYGENGLIIDLFTDSHGRMSVVSRRPPRGSKASHTATSAHLMPLSLVEFECDIHGQGQLPRPHYLSVYHHYQTLQQHPVKVMLSMFIAEFLTQAMREVDTDPLLYRYLEYSLLWLDTTRASFANFHLVFLIRLTRFLGIYPDVQAKKQGFYFDLMTCGYSTNQPLHPHFLHPSEAASLPYIIGMNYDNMHLYRLSRQQRHRCLEVINNYYRLHLPGFGELRSIDILREVFD